MKRITKFLSGNIFIALIVTLIIIYFIPQTFDKYKVDLISKTKLSGGDKIYYYDIDNDGKSEKILLTFRVNPNARIFNNDGGMMMQWNLPGNWLGGSTSDEGEVMFGDYDNNGFNEIYLFTDYEDSIFINSLELIGEDSVIHHTKYIAKTPKYNNKQDFWFSKGKLNDLNNDNYKEVIFSISAGFPLQPRNIFAYDIFQDTVYKSPKSGAMFYNLKFCDLDNDGKEEIMFDTWASGNFPMEFPYIDHSAWLMVFNHKLNFFFEPVGFEGYLSYIYPQPYKVKDKAYIAARYRHAGKLDKKPALYLYNIHGEKIKERKFAKDFAIVTPKNFAIVTQTPEKKDKLYIYENGMLKQLNENLETIKKFNYKRAFPSVTIDVDNDNEDELLFALEGYQKLMIKRNDYSHPVVFDTPNDGVLYRNFSVKLNGDKESHLSVQLGSCWFLFSYTMNPLYYFKYLIYLGIYLGVFLFIYLVQKINSYRLEQEKKKLEQTVKLRTAEIQQQKEEILAQRDEIIESRDEIAQKNKDITDSINYAVRIQNAILPDEEYIKEIIPTTKDGQPLHFILFKPRDIVSGDFYWATKIKNWLIVAAVDCTGHGVPGAFMSMLGVSFLNEIVNKEEITQANQVLNELREYIITSLKQKGIVGETSDGMDMALIVIDTENNMLQFAGANNSLYIVRKESEEVNSQQSAVGNKEEVGSRQLAVGKNPKSETLNSKQETLNYKSETFPPKANQPLAENSKLIEIKGDKMPIGIHEEMKEFANNELQLHKGDTIYLFSDGYVDQFGGEKEKKFKSKPFKKLFLSIQDKSMDEQKEILDKTFDEWKGNLEQVDDVVVIGIRI